MLLAARTARAAARAGRTRSLSESATRTTGAVAPEVAAPDVPTDDSAMTPRATVAKLDEHIVGQSAAKRAVAIALRNRWRRSRATKNGFRSVENGLTPRARAALGPTPPPRQRCRRV